MERADKTEAVSDAFGVELCTLERAVDMRLEFQTDSMLLASALNMHGRDTSQWASTLNELKVHLLMWFSRCDVSSCKREANKVAHELAKIGKSCNMNEAFVWEDDVPSHVAAVVVGDFPLSY